MRVVRVVIADDAVLFREGTARILADAGLDVVGLARDAGELLEHIRKDPPDAAIIDIRMPPGYSSEGIDAAVEIRRAHPDVGVLLLSQHVETRHAMRLMTKFQHGVGYLLKDRVGDLDGFVQDIGRVAAGGCVIDPELITRLVGKRRERDPLAGLTERERSVLALMAQGRSNAALCAELSVSEKTVEAHVRSIFTKLNLYPDAGEHRRVLAVLAFLRS